MNKALHLLISSAQAPCQSLGTCVLLLALVPWGVSAYTSVETEALFPEPRSTLARQQGWYGGLATGFTLFDDATVLHPVGELSLNLDPGALTVGIVGYDLGPLRLGQEVAWHRARLNSIALNGTDTAVAGTISQLKLLSRHRLAFRLTPGSPHAAYVSVGLGALKARIEFEDRITGLVYDESRWAFVYEVQAGTLFKFVNDGRLRIGIRAANAEPHKRVFFDGWINFAPNRRSTHRAYAGGSIGAVDSNARDWSLGYQLGAGLAFQIADRTIFGLDYRYVAMPSFTAHTPGISLRYNF